MDNYRVSQLKSSDWQLWKTFRLDALKNAPESFASSYEEEVDLSDFDFQASLTKNDLFGVFLNQSLISCAGFYSLTTPKTKHRGVIWGMYTQKKYRNLGAAYCVLQEIIKHAKSRVRQLHLTCVTSNTEAISHYETMDLIYMVKYRML